MQGEISLSERHLNRIHAIYNDTNSTDHNSYPIVIWKFPEEDFLNNHVVLPYFKKQSGHHILEFSGAGYLFNVFISNHTKPKYVQSLCLKNDGSIILADIEFKKSGLYRAIQKEVKKMPEYKVP